MKRFLLLSLLAFGFAANAGAQIVVGNNGTTNMGTTQNYISDADAPQATLRVWSINNLKASTVPLYEGGNIAFGRGLDAMVGGDGLKGILQLRAKDSFRLNVSDNILALSFMADSRRFRFGYSLHAPSFIVSSDARYKTNISSLDGISNKLQELNPVSYNLLYPVKSDTLGMAEELSEVTRTISDDRVHFGFVAQEIQNIYPNLVVEDEDGMLSIDYIGFIPVLVEAYKDLSSKVKEQEEYIADILQSVKPSCMPAAVNTIADQKAVLKQNNPNPFNIATSIECTVPQYVSSAVLFIYDLQGKQIRRIDIRERGSVQIVVEASSLTPGMYIYTLVTDGNEIDSKRMIITD